MKRAKGVQTPAFPHSLEFSLLDPPQDIPLDGALDASSGSGNGDEDRSSFGGWYEGRVRIESCPRERTLERLVLKAVICGRLPSRATYWIYHCPKGILLDVEDVIQGHGTMRIPREAAVCMPSRLKPVLSQMDLEHLLNECAPHFALGTAQVARARQCLSGVPESVPSAWAGWQLRFPWVVEHTQMTRAPLIGALFDAFLHPYVGHDAQKQRNILATLPLETLRELATHYEKRPWELLWARTMRVRYGGLKGLRALPDQWPMNRIPLLEQTAVRFLNQLRFSQNEKHTIFGPELFRGTIPCLPQDYRQRFEPQLLQYLQDRDVVFCGPPGFGSALALHADHQDAQLVLQHLERIQARSRRTDQVPLVLRDRDRVPCIPPRLTQDQLAIARHVTQHWLTIVLGSPGTGKTSVLTWVISHYQCVLSTGFVGRLVKMLQKRNGRRPELAYTIDSLIYSVLKSPTADMARRWLATFQVLVIDECSNVSMGRMAKLLMLFPNLRKLVLVGDPNQLAALKAGDFLADMATHFPSHTHRLRENLRVAAGLGPLQDAPSHILHGRPEAIQWQPQRQGCISVVPYAGNSTEETLQSLYSSILHGGGDRARSLLNIQLLALTHQGPHGRKTLNSAFHQVAERLGVLRPPTQRSACITIHKHLKNVYAGCKLTCLKNYNHANVKEFGPNPESHCYNDPIANGEIFIVHRIWKPRSPARGICMEVYDASPDEAIKRLWIDEEEGISPFDLDWGYATTVYKSQGGEFPWVVFCVPPSPAEHWTRANAYVAVSRAQQSCIIMGKVADFNAIARRPDQVRRTVFGYLLSQHDGIRAHVPLEGVPVAEQSIVTDPERECQLLDADELAVPTLKEFLPTPKSAEEKDDF